MMLAKNAVLFAGLYTAGTALSCITGRVIDGAGDCIKLGKRFCAGGGVVEADGV